jgi:hypothetical protein
MEKHLTEFMQLQNKINGILPGLLHLKSEYTIAYCLQLTDKAAERAKKYDSLLRQYENLVVQQSLLMM